MNDVVIQIGNFLLDPDNRDKVNVILAVLGVATSYASVRAAWQTLRVGAWGAKQGWRATKATGRVLALPFREAPKPPEPEPSEFCKSLITALEGQQSSWDEKSGKLTCQGLLASVVGDGSVSVYCGDQKVDAYLEGEVDTKALKRAVLRLVGYHRDAQLFRNKQAILAKLPTTVTAVERPEGGWTVSTNPLTIGEALRGAAFRS